MCMTLRRPWMRTKGALRRRMALLHPPEEECHSRCEKISEIVFSEFSFTTREMRFAAFPIKVGCLSVGFIYALVFHYAISMFRLPSVGFLFFIKSFFDNIKRFSHPRIAIHMSSFWVGKG